MGGQILWEDERRDREQFPVWEDDRGPSMGGGRIGQIEG